MAFEAFLTQDKFRSKKRPFTTALSLAVHAALVLGAFVYSFWHVGEISPPTVTVTFLSNLPPPPPPPPPKKKASSSKVKTTPKTIVQPQEIVQPKEEPPPEPEEPAEEGSDDGVEGGVEGGVVGGVAAGAVGGLVGGVLGALPAPAPPPAPAKFLPPNIAGQQLLTDPVKDPAFRVALPPALAAIGGQKLWALVKICVSQQGDVSEVKIIKGMDPAVDPALRAKILTWKYKPMSIDGHPITFCYNLRYEHNTQ